MNICIEASFMGSLLAKWTLHPFWTILSFETMSALITNKWGLMTTYFQLTFLPIISNRLKRSFIWYQRKQFLIKDSNVEGRKIMWIWSIWYVFGAIETSSGSSKISDYGKYKKFIYGNFSIRSKIACYKNLCQFSV